MSRKKRRPRPAEPARVPPDAAGPPRPRRFSTALVIAAAITTLAAIAAGGWVYRRTAPAAIRPDPGLSVLLVSIDTMRADALGAYGNAAASTPWMDRLAAGGVRFERAYAHNVVTLPSHANMLTGRYPLDHGIRDNSGFRLPAGTSTLATILKARGYRTAAFVSAFPLDSRFGLDAGFDVYDDRFGGGETTAAFRVAERPGPETVAAAARWLSAQGDARVFSFVHLYEPHFPYAPPPALAARFAQRPYHGEVAAADAALEPLLRPLLDAGAKRRMLVVLTSDHGEGLGDHGEHTHGLFAYEAMLRVPLVLYAPGLFRASVVGAPVRHVDLLPTILGALGLEPPADLPGRSLLPEIARGGTAQSPPAYFEALSASMNRGWAPLRGVLHGPWKYIDLPIPELYDVAADPAEADNLAARRPEELERLRATLAALRAEDRGITRVKEAGEALEKLKALGYVSGGETEVKERYGEEDDPKRLVELDDVAQRILDRYHAGDVAGAIALCHETLRRRPDMPITYQHLAYLERARGDLAAAIAAARRAVELRPLDQESVSILGAYLTEAGRTREAVDLLQPYAKQAEPNLDVLVSYGMALATVGRPREALEVFARARAADPSNPMVRVNAGTVHLMGGELGRAREELEAALALDPGVARAHNSLGVIAAREGRTEAALEHWKRAVALDTRDYQTLFNLGVTLRRLGREEDARPYLEAFLRAAPAREAQDVARVRAWLGRPASGGA